MGSEAGDTDDPAVAALRRQEKSAPKNPKQGQPQRGSSAKHNKDKELGNFGLYFGNWGTRGTVGGKEEQRKMIIRQDRQILRNPGHVVVLAEATERVEDLLRQPAEE